MRTLAFAAVICCCLQVALYADSTVCSSGSPLVPVPCDSLTETVAPYQLANAYFLVSAGEINGVSNFNLGGTGGNHVEEVDWVFNDTVAIPRAPAGDVLQISASGTYDQEGGGIPSGFFLKSLGLTAGSFWYSPPYGNCYADSCLSTATVPANQVSSLTMYGSGMFLIGPDANRLNSGVGGGWEEYVTLQLYRADGVTPDVFTPEPASFSLFVLGGLIGAGAYRKRKGKAAL